MNSKLSSTRPRFACRVVRQWCALSGTTDSRHAADCADCQEYFGTVQALDTALRSDALQSVPVMSPGFERRILNTVRSSTRDRGVVPGNRDLRRLIPAGLGGLAVAALAVMLVWSQRAANPNNSHVGAHVTRADAAAVVHAVQNLSSQVVETVIPSTAEFVANNPLQHEAESIYADARAALGFLALNFLPAPQKSSRPPSG